MWLAIIREEHRGGRKQIREKTSQAGPLGLASAPDDNGMKVTHKSTEHVADFPERGLLGQKQATVKQ